MAAGGDDDLERSLRDVAARGLTAEERIAFRDLRASVLGVVDPLLVDRYELAERVGRGSGGTVYHARDTRLDRDVAVKIIAPTHEGSTGRAELEAAVTEARSLAAVRHPHVLAVFDVGTCEIEDAPRAYVVTEFVHGVSLREWLSLPQPRARILEVFERAARGLAAIHAVGLVHGDFKLDNVMLGVDDGVRVCDFGLASRGGRESDPDDPRGTPGYLAPECVAGGRPTAASDQFAFFVALHRALFRCAPSPGADGFVVGNPAQTHGPIPRALVEEIERGLRVDPLRRAASMSKVADALARFGRRRSFALRVAIGGFAIAIVGVVVGVVAAEHSGAPVGLVSPAMDRCLGLLRDRQPHPMLPLPLPEPMMPVVDPAFGARLVRVGTFVLPVDRPRWEPGTLAWSADERWFLSRSEQRGHVVLHDGSTYAAVEELALGVPRWSHREASIVYGFDPLTGSLVRHDVVEGRAEPVVTLGPCADGPWQVGPGLSWDRERMGLRCGDTAFFVSAVDGVASARVPARAVLEPAPSGAAFVLAGEVRNEELAILHTLDLAEDENSTMTQSRRGADVYVAVAFDPSPRGTPVGSVVSYALADARTSHAVVGPTSGWPYPKTGTRLAAAGPSSPGWVAVRSTGDPAGREVLDQELLLVDVDVGDTCRVAHHRATVAWQLALSPRGTRILFETDWGEKGGPLHTFVAELPAFDL